MFFNKVFDFEGTNNALLKTKSILMTTRTKATNINRQMNKKMVAIT